MNPQTKAALEGSIKKWRKIVKGTGVDEGKINCPLCKLYNCSSCKKCIIAKKTGKNICQGTPYSEWAEHTAIHKPFYDKYFIELFSKKVHCPTCKKLAEKELEFLKSLRERGK